MKTLKQQAINYIDISELNFDCKHDKELWVTLTMIREWLEQKRQVRTATNTYANIGYQQAITELLEELKQ